MFDHDVLALDVPALTKPLAECLHPRGGPRSRLEKANLWHLPRLLCLGGKRRGEDSERAHQHRRTGAQRATEESSEQEAAALHYSITSSARSSSDGGIVRPRTLAVLRLMISSNR